MRFGRKAASEGVIKPEKLISKDYIMIILASTGTSSMNFFFLATLSPYMTMLTGKALNAGLLATVFSVAALLARPASGILSDKFGRVRQLIAGAVISGVTCAAFGMTTSFAALLAIRAINGIGFGMHSTCSGAVVADIVPKSRLTEGIGYFGLYGTASQMLAPVIALAIVAGGKMSDYRNMFITLMCICFASAIFDCLISYERKRKKATTAAFGADGADALGEASPAVESNAKASSADMLPQTEEPLPKTFFGFEYAVFAPVVMIFVMYFGITSIMSYITGFAGWMGFQNSGLYFTFSAVGVLFSRLFFGRLADKKGADIIVIPGVIVLTICLALIPFVKSMTQLVILAIPLGMAQGAVLPTVNSLIFIRCSPTRRGTASGAYFAAVDIGFAIGAPLLGAIADALNYRYMYWTGAVFAALSLVVYLLAVSDRQYNRRKATRG